MESIIKDCILNPLNKLSLIRDSQHRITKNRSCLTNLLEFMEEVTSILDSRKSVDIDHILRFCESV